MYSLRASITPGSPDRAAWPSNGERAPEFWILITVLGRLLGEYAPAVLDMTEDELKQELNALVALSDQLEVRIRRVDENLTAIELGDRGEDGKRMGWIRKIT